MSHKVILGLTADKQFYWEAIPKNKKLYSINLVYNYRDNNKILLSIPAYAQEYVITNEEGEVVYRTNKQFILVSSINIHNKEDVIDYNVIYTYILDLLKDCSILAVLPHFNFLDCYNSNFLTKPNTFYDYLETPNGIILSTERQREEIYRHNPHLLYHPTSENVEKYIDLSIPKHYFKNLYNYVYSIYLSTYSHLTSPNVNAPEKIPLKIQKEIVDICSEPVIEQLFKHKDFDAVETTKYILKKKRFTALFELLKHRRLPYSIQKKLFKIITTPYNKEADIIRPYLLEYKFLDGKIIDKVLKSKNKKLLESLALNPRLSPYVIDKLFDMGGSIRNSLAMNPNLDMFKQNKFIKLPKKELKKYVAYLMTNENLIYYHQHILYENFPKYRTFLCCNPSIDPELAKKIIKTKDLNQIELLARTNPNKEIQMLIYKTKINETKKAEYLLGNQKLSEDLAIEIAKKIVSPKSPYSKNDGAWFAYQLVCGYKKVPEKVYEILSQFTHPKKEVEEEIKKYIKLYQIYKERWQKYDEGRF